MLQKLEETTADSKHHICDHHRCHSGDTNFAGCTCGSDWQAKVNKPNPTDVAELRKSAKYVFRVVEEDIAHDLSGKLNRAANTIEALQKLVEEAPQFFPVDSFDGRKIEWIKRADLLKA